MKGLRRWVVGREGSREGLVGGFERVQHRPLRRRIIDVQPDLRPDAGQVAKVMGQDDADHESVWTCTESTRGRSSDDWRQLSPPSAEPYTFPPVVPK